MAVVLTRRAVERGRAVRRGLTPYPAAPRILFRWESPGATNGAGHAFLSRRDRMPHDTGDV